jgi:hypothetical protein
MAPLGRLFVLSLLVLAVGVACTEAPGGRTQTTTTETAGASPSYTTRTTEPSIGATLEASAAASASPSAPTTGRIAEPKAGFALTLADGWARNDDPGEGFYLVGGRLLAEDGLGSRISVALYPLSMLDPAQAADPIGVAAEALMASMPGGRPFSMPALDPTVPTASPTDLPGSTTRSAVNLPAGPAVRLDGVVEGGQNMTVWLLDGGFVGTGAACEVQGAIHMVTAWFADPAALSVIEEMARSLELLPHGTVLEAIGC